MSGFPFGSSVSTTTSSQSTPSPFSFSSAATASAFSFGSSASPFGSSPSPFSFASSSSTTTTTAANPISSAPPDSLGFGSSTPSFSFPFNSASTPPAAITTSSPFLTASTATTTTSRLFGTTPSATTTPSAASPLFGSSTTAATTTSPLFGSTPSLSPFATSLSTTSSTSSPFLSASSNLFAGSGSSSSASTTAPSFSFAPNSTASSSGLSFSNASAFSKPTPSPSTATTTSPFSFLTPSSAASVSTTSAAKPSSSAAPLFSTITTTSASTPAASTTTTTTTTSQPSFSVPSFGFTPSSASTAPSISVPASSAAASSSSSTASSFTGFGVTSAASTTASLGTTGFNFSKLSTPASSSQAQSTTTAPVFRCPFFSGESCVACSAKLFKNCVGDRGDGVEGKQLGDGMVKKPMLPNAVTVEEAKEEVASRVEKDHDEIMEVVEMKVAGLQEGLESLAALAMDSVPGNVVSFPTIASSAISSMSQIAKATVVTPEILKAELSVIGSEGVMLLGKEVKGGHKGLSPVKMEAKNDLDTSASKAFKVDEASDSGLGMQTSPLSSLCVEMDSHVCSSHKGPIIKSILYKYGDKPSPLSSLCVEVDKHVLSPHNGPIIKSILYKYGDITMGSTFRSMDAKLAFLELMADAVYRLSNLTLDTVSSHEIQLIEAKVADVLAAGFNVKWLKQRVDEVIASTKYQEYCMELDELDKQIEATKKSLVDMEQQRVVLAREVIAIKAQNERNGILGHTLAEGLL